MSIETLPLFGEPERPEVPAVPKAEAVQWTGFHPTKRTQCMHCVQNVHSRHGAGRVNIRTARRRRTGPDGELLLCGAHADAKHADDIAAGLIPPPRKAAARRRR